jgi:hypothetical protein
VSDKTAAAIAKRENAKKDAAKVEKAKAKAEAKEAKEAAKAEPEA